MAHQMQAVPVIDISPFFGGNEAEQKSIVHAWDRAFSSVGFAVITGHDIPEEVVDEAYKAAKEFFGLSHEENRMQYFGKGYGAGGFTPVGGERVNATLKEAQGPTRLVEPCQRAS
jgi:isopenicillin N synthase-like dioxygenase